jgi:hypothetical protein
MKTDDALEIIFYSPQYRVSGGAERSEEEAKPRRVA